MFMRHQHRINRRKGIVIARCFVQPCGFGLLVGHLGHVLVVVGQGRVGRIGVCLQKTEHLLPKVRTTVDEDEPMVVGFDEGGSARALVFWVGRTTHRAMASHLRYARRSAGAEKVEFHVVE